MLKDIFRRKRRQQDAEHNRQMIIDTITTQLPPRYQNQRISSPLYSEINDLELTTQKYMKTPFPATPGRTHSALPLGVSVFKSDPPHCSAPAPPPAGTHIQQSIYEIPVNAGGAARNDMYDVVYKGLH